MTRKVFDLMIAIGVFLIIIALLAHGPALGGIGLLLIVVGVILEILGMMGRAVGGRRHYY
jgi:hypothetical protein